MAVITYSALPRGQRTSLGNYMTMTYSQGGSEKVMWVWNLHGAPRWQWSQTRDGFFVPVGHPWIADPIPGLA